MIKTISLSLISITLAIILMAANQLAHAASLANKGYDVVSYFDVGQPEEGLASISYEWNDKEWRFTSTAHRDLFVAEPEKYAPAYDGNCAWAVSQGYTAPTVPEAWSIIDGRLFLNYSLSVRRTWLEDPRSNIKAGDENWPALKDSLFSRFGF
jgi:hypothetical protein